MSKNGTKSHHSDGFKGDNVSIKRTPLTKKLIIEKKDAFHMVMGDGYAMPIMHKRDV